MHDLTQVLQTCDFALQVMRDTVMKGAELLVRIQGDFRCVSVARVPRSSNSGWVRV